MHLEQPGPIPWNQTLNVLWSHDNNVIETMPTQ